MKVHDKKNIILKPSLSEKTLKMYNDFKICTFWVSSKSTKEEIISDFFGIYGIKPVSIKTLMLRSSTKTRSRKTYRTSVRRFNMKKAYIAIGDNKLNIFENIK